MQTSFKEKEVKNELNPIGGTGRGPIGAGGPACIRRAGGVAQSPRPDVEVGLIEKKVKRHRNKGLVRCVVGGGCSTAEARRTGGRC